tara:strand:- start:909 stop:1712 length:804 start_codon:yes stop_codon:yes gene_type:complete
MKYLYNMGCSFAFGNCADKKNHICDTHLSPGTLLAKHLELKEVNYASPGAGIDTVLKRLYTHEFKDGVVLIGVPHSNRFQVASTKERRQNKERNPYKVDKTFDDGIIKRLVSKLQGEEARASSGAPIGATQARKLAFSKGPEIPKDMFCTNRWHLLNAHNIDIDEQQSYHIFKNIVLIQARLKEMNMPYYMYNSVESVMPKQSTNWEVQKLKDKISLTYYYKPNNNMWEDVLKRPEFMVADDDSHPNQQAYRNWFEGFKQWINIDNE